MCVSLLCIDFNIHLDCVKDAHFSIFPFKLPYNSVCLGLQCWSTQFFVNSLVSEIQHQHQQRERTFPPQKKKNRQIFSLHKKTTHKISLRKTKVRDERFIYHIYIYQVLALALSLSLCVCVSRSRTRIHGVFFIPSFCSLLFPTMKCVLDYSRPFFKAR